MDAFTARDYNRAFKHLKPLAERGEAVAQRTLGAMFYDPTPGWVDADHRTAARWYARAAEQGDTGAQYALALLYLNHEGLAGPGMTRRWISQLRKAYIPTDATEAYKWLSLAARGGHKDANTRRAKLRKQLSKRQLAQAREQAQQWRPTREGGAELDPDAPQRLSRREIKRL